MAEQVLRFGGPGLPPGAHTFYTTPEHAELRAEAGAEIPVAQVANAKEFIDRGMASIVTKKGAAAVPPAAPAAE